MMNELFKIIVNEQNNEDNESKDFKYFVDLLLSDYITFYLLKSNQNNYNCNDIEHKLILKLINLRFKDDHGEKEVNIIKQNKSDNIKKILIKILWIESNKDYIMNIIKIYDILSSLLSSLESPFKKSKIFNDLCYYVKKGDIRYISSEKRNPEHTREINECFYIILASICQSITNEDILNQFNNNNIYYYIQECQYVLPIITKLSDDLYLYLNERFIIEEFLLIIDVGNRIKNQDIDFSINILNKLKNLSNIIQSFNKVENDEDKEENDEEKNETEIDDNKENDADDKIIQLNSAFKDINEYIIKELNQNNSENFDNENDKNNDEYYNLLANIYFKEIKKITDINYRKTVLDQILANDKIIKKSLESFKLLLKNILQPELEKFGKILDNLTKKKDEIFYMIEDKKSIMLDETLLYLFEKNSFIYFDKAMSLSLDKKIKEEKFKSYKQSKNPSYAIFDEPLTIFRDCIEYLESICEKNDNKAINKKMKKLFCLAFIRVYIYRFIYIKKDSKQIKDEEIIKCINGKNDSKLRNMLRLYLYKVIFYINNKGDIYSPEIQEQFHLKKYVNYNNFIDKNQNIYLEEFLLPSDIYDFNKFEDNYRLIKSYEKNKFKSIDINEIKEKLEDSGDTYYAIFSDILFTYLLETVNHSFSENQNNFWNNIFEKIFQRDKKSLLKFIFNPKDLKNLCDKYNIGKTKNQIEILLYSLRFCFRTLNSSKNECIYKKILNGDKDCIKDSYFVGSDIEENNYFDIYLKLKDHFNKKSKKEGAYVCLCKNGYYQYIPPDGYPTKEKNSNEVCLYCSKEIGYHNGYLWNKYIVNREGYYRIFKNFDDIGNEPQEKIEKINNMTFEQFENDYINPLYLKQKKGIFQVSSAHFKKPNKKIRYMNSQISYRLLNFILWSHLFFADLVNTQLDFDLPQGMNIIEVLEQDWKKLENELKKNRNIDIKIFMNFIFKNLNEELNEIEEIDDINDLFNNEKKLENIINSFIEKYNEYKEKYINFNNKLGKIDLDSSMNLLNENYDISLYKEEIYPFYKYFLYTKYVLEDNMKLDNKDGYEMIDLYINKNKYNNEINHLETLDIFNKFNNLLFESYTNKITRKNAEQKKLNEEPVYFENKKIFEDFFKNIKNIDENLDLKEDDNLSKFLIDKNSEESDKLVKIYDKYIEEQNKIIRDLIKKKHDEKGFLLTEEINVQSIQKDEIFTFKLKNTSFIEIIFENSYRDKSFRNIIVNYENIEEILTDKLLRKTKLVNNNLKYIIYINEEYLHENTSKYNEFINIFEPLKNINNVEKIKIKKFIDSKIENINQCLNIINGFDTIVLNLNERFKIRESNIEDQNNKPNGENDEATKGEEERENDEKEEEKEKEELNEMNEEEKKDILNQEENNNEQNKIREIKEITIKEIINKYIGDDKISNEFNDLINLDKSFTLDKLIDILFFSEKIMFSIIKEDIKKYCSDLSSSNKKEIDDFYKNDNNNLISKEVLITAIRRYLIRYLSREKDKDNYLKNNKRNFIKYLYIEDLWDNKINKEEKKKKNEMEKFKNMNISIDQIINLYDILGGDDLINEEINGLKDNDMSLINIISQDKDIIKEDIDFKVNDDQKDAIKDNENSNEKDNNSDNPDNNSDGHNSDNSEETDENPYGNNDGDDDDREE